MLQTDQRACGVKAAPARDAPRRPHALSEVSPAALPCCAMQQRAARSSPTRHGLAAGSGAGSTRPRFPAAHTEVCLGHGSMKRGFA